MSGTELTSGPVSTPEPSHGRPGGPRFVPVAAVVRSGFTEGAHYGVVVLTGPDGVVRRAAGDPLAPLLPRSANKPAQAVGMLQAGLGDVLDRAEPGERQQLVAMATSSHSGEPSQLALVDRILGLAGLGPGSLACPPALPFDEVEADRLIAAGGGPTRRHMNCSGKHAAMLATCVAAGWPTEGYLALDHPLQQALRSAVSELADEPITAVAVDGCGAPLFAISAAGLARTFGRIASADLATAPAEAEVAAAVVAHPAVVSGTRRPLVPLLAALPGAVAKDGAEGVFALGLPDGRGYAVKVADGAMRATVPVLVAVLRSDGLASSGLEPLAESPLLGGGEQVGSVRALADLLG